jgi:hypothetical protein
MSHRIFLNLTFVAFLFASIACNPALSQQIKYSWAGTIENAPDTPDPWGVETAKSYSINAYFDPFVGPESSFGTSNRYSIEKFEFFVDGVQATTENEFFRLKDNESSLDELHNLFDASIGGSESQAVYSSVLMPSTTLSFTPESPIPTFAKIDNLAGHVSPFSNPNYHYRVGSAASHDSYIKAELTGPEMPSRNSFVERNIKRQEGRDGVRSAIVMIHGNRDSPNLFNEATSSGSLGRTDMAASMTKVLNENGLHEQYDVFVYDWSEDAQGGLVLPSRAKEAAAGDQGLKIAYQLAREGYDEHVHFIAHSLGGRAANEASRLLKDSPTWNGSIHTTFLDAYTPNGWEDEFGKYSDFSEHYYNKNDLAVVNTQSNFAGSYNVDTSSLEGAFEGGSGDMHKFPVRWYDETIDLDLPGHRSVGFEYSRESGGAWPPRTIPINEAIVLGLASGNETTIQFQTDLEFDAFDAENQLINHSETGTFEFFDSNSIELETGSPIWLNFEVPASSHQFLEFDLLFSGNRNGLLSVYLDGDLIGLFDEEYSLAGVFNSGRLGVGAFSGQNQVLSLRLDSVDEFTAGASIDNMRFGSIVSVPEPNTTVIVGFIILALTTSTRRRRSASRFPISNSLN